MNTLLKTVDQDDGPWICLKSARLHGNSTNEFLSTNSIKNTNLRVPELILLSYRFDKTNVLIVFPVEIVYFIIGLMGTTIIEFEHSVNTRTLERNEMNYHKGSKYPYTIESISGGMYIFKISNRYLDIFKNTLI